MASTRDTRTVMIVDSEPAQQRFLSALVSRGGWRSIVAGDTDTALAKLGTQEGMGLDAVLVDQGTPGVEIAEFVSQLRSWRPALPLVVITMRNGVEVAVAAMRAGATDFVQKPIAPDRLLGALDRIVNSSGPQGELRPLTEKLRAPLGFEEIIGSSPNFRSALAIAAKAARARVPVMIKGKPGTGKEVFARAIHAASPRSRGALVMVDCSAVSPGLIGSGLFGHERGAFPGAFDRQIGRLVQADGGSIIIDHVECIPLETQAKLVEFLNSGEVQMIGGTIRQTVDVRIISTSASPLDKLIEAGHFREDLYYALTAAQFTLPSLSERRGDVGPLARHLIDRIGGLPGMGSIGVTDDALRLLASYAWPGNVRQLQDVLFRAAVASKTDVLTSADFGAIDAALSGGTVPASEGNIAINGEAIGVTLYLPDGNLRPLEEIEADVIRLAIGHYRGRMSEVARRLGIGRSTLYRKLSDLGIDTAA
ncbi:sigma-54 dependent transcriptional regulator [Sphingopyxis sp. XHP0097]|uniref:DNA-binding transcriptional regulator NtrC n=1 Tax=Sphingopyxis jiangsuensis TaxID=2871171 RepID=A0ABS7MD61_9SPHN|nr:MULTISPECIES: sigma-54 dependent transcriptional regulator [Sphingopyxis]MBL0767387.1 sigma-54-dependent Fis family transcriptional regulator [Sphingopyxis lutea]MBY4636953.1 sigma-54 dependent transcriptional regulator [Sphingopyxis jiangsuensis]